MDDGEEGEGSEVRGNLFGGGDYLWKCEGVRARHAMTGSNSGRRRSSVIDGICNTS